jgi:predicted transcriptional regulator
MTYDEKTVLYLYHLAQLAKDRGYIEGGEFRISKTGQEKLQEFISEMKQLPDDFLLKAAIILFKNESIGELIVKMRYEVLH